jgi:hypothetical protein
MLILVDRSRISCKFRAEENHLDVTVGNFPFESLWASMTESPRKIIVMLHFLDG